MRVWSASKCSRSRRSGARPPVLNMRYMAGCFLVVMTFGVVMGAQQAAVAPLVRGPVDDSVLTVLRGNTHPLAVAKYDRGMAPDDLPMQRMLLVLKRSSAQETALRKLLDDQQNSASPNYHKWLTPEEFGKQFGAGDADVQAVTAWLTQHGFGPAIVSKGRTVIEFSGTAGQVRDAFHTEIHKFDVNGDARWANASDPQIPTALAGLVAGVDTLHNFPRHSMARVAGPVSRDKKTGQFSSGKPLFTFPGSNGGCGVPPTYCYGVGPYDFATIYNVASLWNASINGNGQTIGIVGETDINPQDVSDFRHFFGLPGTKLIVTHNGPDPGILQDGEETESALDVEWSGAVAPGATVNFVVTAATNTSLGVDLSAQYIIDNNLTTIVSESYGACELGVGTAGNQFYNQMWQQAAAQGITVFVSSGDNGGAGCDSHSGSPGTPSQFGLQVSGFESTPYNVSVGGTDFYDWTTAPTYWNATNAATTLASAKSYIPETTWNNTCTNSVFGDVLGFSNSAEANCNNGQLYNFVSTVGGSGGHSSCTTSDGQHPSSCTGGYAKPSWQTALTPNDGKRDVPDVSLYAASGGPSGSFYVICEADLIQSGSSCDAQDPSTQFLAIGGTSASSPAMAGIMALVNQKNGGRQGNANYVFYKLAGKQQPSGCNSTSGSGSSCIFNDVTNGTIAMPCITGSPNCTTSTPGDEFGVLSGYATQTGYDRATGLGTINAANLVNQWSSATAPLAASIATLNSVTPSSITHGQSVSVSVTVAPKTGSGTPTGVVSLLGGPGGTLGIDSHVLTSGTATWNTTALPGGGSSGTYALKAHYAGDSSYTASDSTPINVTVAREASQTSAYLVTFDSAGNVLNPDTLTAPYGSPYILQMNIANSAGQVCTGVSLPASCPSGTISLTDNGTSLNGGQFALNNTGTATDYAIQLTGGSHAVVASYPGDNSYNASTGDAAITIAPAITNMSLTAFPGNVVAGSQATFAGAILTQSSGVAPTGTIVFTDNGNPLNGTLALVGASGGAGVSATTAFTFTTTFSTAGSHSVMGAYSGDSNYGPSQLTFGQYVLFGTSTALSANPPTVQYPNSVTLTALVDSRNASTTPLPTGTVTFNGTYAGQIPGSVAYTNLTDGSGNQELQATLTYSPTYSDTVTATYSGDFNYNGTSSTGISITVNGGPTPTFSLPQNGGSLSISSPGLSGNTTLQVTSVGGFSGNVSFTCAVPGAMKEATCTLVPMSVAVSNSNAGSTTLSVTTTGPHSSSIPRTPGWMLRGGSLMFAAIVMAGLRPGRRRSWIHLGLMVVLALTLGIVGCGGGSGSSGGTSDSGTPAGNYTVVVTAKSGSLPAQTSNVTVNLQ
jgi:subtilase family serine protease